MDHQHSGELYLSCQGHGIINLLHAVQGYRDNQDDARCPLVQNQGGQDCAQDVSSWNRLLQSCMGLSQCYVVVPSVELEQCPLEGEVYSNYLQVQYQCVAGKGSSQSLVCY